MLVQYSLNLTSEEALQRISNSIDPDPAYMPVLEAFEAMKNSTKEFAGTVKENKFEIIYRAPREKEGGVAVVLSGYAEARNAQTILHIEVDFPKIVSMMEKFFLGLGRLFC
jgi:hypothetical protein